MPVGMVISQGNFDSDPARLGVGAALFLRRASYKPVSVSSFIKNKKYYRSKGRNKN